MVDMASKKIFQAVLCPTQLFQWKLICTFNQHSLSYKKICDDKAGNLPNKGRNFNTQTWGKIVYFLFVWLVGIGFRQNFFRELPNFGDFGAKCHFFHYIINQNRNNFIKHRPPRVPRSRWYQRCVSIQKVRCASWVLVHGGNDVL